MAWNSTVNAHWAKEMGQTTLDMLALKEKADQLIVDYFANSASSSGDWAAAAGMSTGEMVNLVTFWQQVENLIGNQAVSQGDYQTTVSQAMAGYRAEIS